MNREQAIATALSALKLRSNVTCNRSGAWTWRKFGWMVVMWESGELVCVTDEWKGLDRCTQQ